MPIERCRPWPLVLLEHEAVRVIIDARIDSRQNDLACFPQVLLTFIASHTHVLFPQLRLEFLAFGLNTGENIYRLRADQFLDIAK